MKLLSRVQRTGFRDGILFSVINGLLLGVILCCICAPITAYSNPEGGEVAAGSAVISTPSANTVQIQQSSDKAIINWQSYNIQSNEQVNYQQPSASSIALNRINPQQGPSNIYGTITANGRVWLVNPAGIYFGPNAYVNVGGLLATTAGISDEEFLAGRYRFIQSPDWHGSVINEGYIKTSEAGLVALVGSGVVNNGMIEANLGTVVLAAGSEFTVNFSGNEMIGFAVEKAVIEPAQDQNGNRLADGVTNTGTIIANGGKVMMSAHTASDILDHTINVKGIVQANSVSEKNGVIILDGGTGKVKVTGKLIASGKKDNEKGGTVKILGRIVILTDLAMIDVSGKSGGGTVLVGGNAHGTGPEQNADYAYVGHNATINADALQQGNGGNVVVWSNLGTQFYGSIFARGGSESGDGGWVETSGKEYLSAYGSVNASAISGQGGMWLLDPRNVTIQNASTSGGAFSGASPNVFTPTADDAVADRNTIQTSLNGGTSVTVNTGASGTQNGDITVSDTISKTAGGAATLTLTAASTGTITINQIISSTTGALSVLLNGAKTIAINAGITTNGGTFTSTSTEATTISAAVSSGAGAVAINANTGASGANDFAIAGGGSIATTNTGTSAVVINVNGAGGGTGGITLAGNITTGSGGRITLATNTGANTTGGSITQSSGTLSVVGAGSFVFSAPTATSSSIGTSGAAIATTSAGGTATLTTGTGGAFISNTGNLTLAAPTLATNSPLSVISSAVLTLPAASISTGTGDLTLKSNGGALATIATRTLTTTSGNMVLTGSTGLTINSTLTTDLGNLTLSTTTSGTLTQSAAGNIVSTSGNLSMTSIDAITLNTSSDVGSGKVTIAANSDGAGANTFTMNAGSSITTTSTAADAVSVAVNTAVGGTGAAVLRDITTGGTGTLTVTTDTGGNTTGGTLTTPSGTLTVGSLLMSTPSTMTLTGAISAGGTITLNTNTDGAGAQAFSMAAGSSITTTSTSASAVAINVNAAAGGTGTAAVRGITTGSGGTITVKTDTGGNATGGDITMAAGTLDVGTGTVTLTNPQITNNNIGVSATPIQIVAGTLNATTGTSGVFVTNTGTGSLDLGTINSTGAFTLTSTSSSGITDSGSVIVSGITTLVAGATQDITLDSASNNFATATITSGKNVTVTDTNGIILGLSTISGTFNLNTGGAITQSGAVAVTGTTTIAAGSGNDITLATATNDFSTVAITSGNNVSLRDANTLDVGTSTISGTLALTASGVGGAITQSGALAVTGTTTIVTSTTNDVTLDNSGNNFSTVAVTSGNNVSLRDTNALILGTSTVSGTFGVTTNGSLTQSGTIIVTGVTTLAAGAANDITLGTAANNFTTVGVTSGNNVTLRDTNAIILGTSNVATNLTVTAGGAITQSGVLTVPTLVAKTLVNAGAAISLNTFINEATTIDLRARNTADTANAAGAISYLDGTGFDVAAANTTSTVTLTSGDTATLASGGPITQSGSMAGTTLTVKTLNNAGAAITLDDAANAFTTIDMRARNLADTANAAGAITYQDSNAIAIADIDTASTFTLTANTTISQTGALTVTGTPTFIASAANTDISLATSDNDLSSSPVFSVTGAGTIRDIALKNISASASVPTLPTGMRNLTFNFTNAAVAMPGTTLTGTLSLTANGAITQTGPLVVTGVTTLASGAANNITLNDSGNNFSTVTVTNGNNVALTDSNGLILGAATVSGTFDVTAGGALTQSGTLTITGVTTFDTGASNITLATATNDFSTVKVTSANNVSLRDANVINMGLSTIGGTLAITASGVGGGITQTDLTAAGKLVVTGVTTLVAGTLNDISLANPFNDFGTVGITSGNNVTLKDTNALNLAASTVTGDLTLTTGGAISDSGNIVVSGSTGLTATSVGGTVLNSASNQISKFNVSNSGSGNVTLITIVPVTVTGFSQSGGGTTNFTVTGALTVADGVTINASNAALTITATDLDLSTTGALNSGTAATSITQNTASGSIGLGATAGTMSISGAELQRITATGLSLIAPTDGSIIVDGITSTNSANISGTTTLTATAGTLGTISFQTGASSFGTLTATSDNGTSVNANLSTTVGALTFTVNAGTLSVADAVTASTTNSALAITATDLNLNTTGALSSGTADMTITQNTATGSIGFGDTAGTMSISSAELLRMTANNFNLTAASNGSIIIDNITAAAGANIAGTTTLTATAGTLGSMTFQNNASSFKALTGNTDNGITVGSGAGITTTTGNLALNADVGGGVGGSDSLNLNANLTAAGSMTLSATNGGIILAAPITLTAVGVTLSSAVNGAFNLTVDAGSGATSFASTVGATTPVGSGTGAAITLNSSGATTFANTVTTNSGISATGAVTFNNTVTLGNGDTGSTFTGLVTLSNVTGYTFSGFDGLSFNGGLTTSGGAMTVNTNNSTLSIAALTLGSTLTLLSGTSATNVTGAVSGSGQTLILQDNTAGSTGTVTFSNNISLGGLTTFAQPYSVVFTGSSNSFTNSVTFNNTTSTTLGSGSSTFDFSGGLAVLSSLINLASTINTSGYNLTLGDSSSDQTMLNGAVTLTSSGGAITINSLLDGANNLTMAAGSGDIAFNANVGGATRLSQLLIQTVRNLANAGTLNVTTYVQNAGSGTTTFNNPGLNATGSASITANNLLGSISVSSLAIGLNTGNFTGTVGGQDGVPAIRTFTILNRSSIGPGRIFFDGYDIFTVLGGGSVNPSLVFPTNYMMFTAQVDPNWYSEYLLYLQTFEQEKRDECLVIAPAIKLCGNWNQ